MPSGRWLLRAGGGPSAAVTVRNPRPSTERTQRPRRRLTVRGWMVGDSYKTRVAFSSHVADVFLRTSTEPSNLANRRMPMLPCSTRLVTGEPILPTSDYLFSSSGILRSLPRPRTPPVEPRIVLTGSLDTAPRASTVVRLACRISNHLPAVFPQPRASRFSMAILRDQMKLGLGGSAAISCVPCPLSLAARDKSTRPIRIIQSKHAISNSSLVRSSALRPTHTLPQLALRE